MKEALIKELTSKIDEQSKINLNNDIKQKAYEEE